MTPRHATLACCLLAWSGAHIARAQAAPRPPVTLTYLGTAGWQITYGTTVILVDPYLTRLPLLPDRTALAQAATADRRPIPPGTVLVPDTAAIDAHVRRADLILIHHSHFDHILDAPYIARKTKAIVLGHESATNVMRASGIPQSQLVTVRGGEDYVFGNVSVRVLPSIHSPLFQKHYYDGRTIPATISPPFTLGDLAEGGSLAFLIRIGGHRILTFGSMNYMERELQGLRPDVVLAGAGESRAENYDYAGRLMRALGSPGIVLPTHWDNYFVPFDAPQDESLARLRAFVDEIHAASPHTRVIIPKYFEPISLPENK